MKKLKKAFVLILAVMMTMVMFAGYGQSTLLAKTKSAKKYIKVGVVCQNLGTHSFNDDVVAGVKAAGLQRGAKNILPVILEIASVTEAYNGITTLINQGCKLVIVPNANYKDGMIKAAKDFPKTKFIFTEGAIEGHSNIMSLVYEENQASFLAGALGALMTKTGKIGVVLANTSQSQNNYLFGYTAGAKAVKPKVRVMSAFTNSFSDINQGQQVAGVMYQKGCDYVGTYAGSCNLGVFNAAKNAGDGKYCFGASTGQFDAMPDKILASVVKPINKVLLKLLINYAAGKFTTSVSYSLGLKENGVALLFTDNTNLKNSVPANVMTIINNLTKKIINGSIKVPNNKADLDKFTYKYGK
jgi:basic membrane protein A